MIKTLILISTALFIIICLGFIVFKPTVDNFTHCLDLSIARLNQISETSQKENWDEDTLCGNLKKDLLSVSFCIQKAKEQNIIAPLIWRYPKAKYGIKKTFDMHNQTCPQYYVEPVDWASSVG